ncbi:hypothetical protein F3B77_11790 [Bacteroides ovatus]|uniref:Uncharacterized protein n=1 Tax=Bacteroides ovatus TaxID=28116 RepID=A0A5M5M546_BACOV|nr:hypothetical protein [Bacteroides ovatus]KAA4070627.1 hypothetical protein F3D37_09130 [Bacteroides ovatus]KAA4078666.1 hypothetical protein F3D38_10170 [Bacteroides ovatus]KAA4097544.1 hypothetical protein F3D40_12120 [Bacteroides ovatus]KAA4112532.1 hypothetical protein F3D35_13050 [Bacteroides ovatus]KAA4114060.1 hypothetical protein F3D39_10370 [Bacteroides ovatus]
MKQTLEEAAKENILFNHRTVDRTLSGKDLAQFGEINFIQGAEWHAKQSIEVLSSVLENWVHGGDADCIIAEFEEKLNNK